MHLPVGIADKPTSCNGAADADSDDYDDCDDCDDFDDCDSCDNCKGQVGEGFTIPRLFEGSKSSVKDNSSKSENES